MMAHSTQKVGPLYWIGWFLFYFFAVVAVLAVTAGVIFILVGAVTHPDKPIVDRALLGLRNGAELGAKVWAPAISIVLCVMKGYRRAQAQAEEETSHEV